MFSRKINLLNINFHFLYTYQVVLICPRRSKVTYFASFCHLEQTIPAKTTINATCDLDLS